MIDKVNEMINNTLRDSLEDLSWNDIFKLANNGILHAKYEIGSSKNITLKSGEVVTMQFADYYNGHTAFISKDCLETPMTMKYCGQDYPNDFKDSIIYNYLNTQIFDLLPDDLHDLLSNSTEYLTLPSEYNVFGKDIYSVNSLEDLQWSIFKDPKNRIKKLGRSGAVCGWWESSPNVSDYKCFCGVNTLGVDRYYHASHSLGIPLCFTI